MLFEAALILTTFFWSAVVLVLSDGNLYNAVVVGMAMWEVQSYFFSSFIMSFVISLVIVREYTSLPFSYTSVPSVSI